MNVDHGYKYQPPVLEGSVDVAVRFDNHGEYLKWKKYVQMNREWEFDVSYPAIMRMNCEFHSSLDVDILTKKIVQLLQMGFNVHTANWKLMESQQKQAFK